MKLFYQVLLNSLHAGKLNIKFTATHQYHNSPLVKWFAIHFLTLLPHNCSAPDYPLCFIPTHFCIYSIRAECMTWICLSQKLHISVEVASQCTFTLAECSPALLSSAEIYVTAVGCACGKQMVASSSSFLARHITAYSTPHPVPICCSFPLLH